MNKFWMSALITSFICQAHAASLSVAPKPGQWQINTQNYAEGQDIAPRLDAIKKQAAAFLEPKYLERLSQFDPSQFNECLTPKQAALLQEPAQSLDVIGQALGQCTLQLDGQTDTSMRFSGYCNASKQGISGNITGQVHYLSPTQAEGHIDGVGGFPPHLQLLLLGYLKSELQVRHQFNAQWQQAQCVRK